MKIGTKSLLFGCHQFLLHPYYTFKGWIALYGWDSKGYSWWKLIICFIIHDWGYWGCKDMDGEEGERHVEWAADKAGKYLDPRREYPRVAKYYILCRYHSRFIAKNAGTKPSPLCWADKVGTALMPSWLWVFLGRLTGELDEYMTAMKHREDITATDPVEYHKEYAHVISKLLHDNNIPSARFWKWSREILGLAPGKTFREEAALWSSLRLFRLYKGGT